jgi:hypothetical protein
MDPLIFVILVICVAGAVALLIKKAPFIDAEYKPYALWFVLAIVVILCIKALWPLLTGVHLTR